MRYFLAIVGMLMILIGAYLAGFDFNERGATTLFVYSLTVWCGLGGYVLGMAMEPEGDLS
jgi:hypothetical protein